MKHKGLLVAAVLLGLSSIGLNAQANADGKKYLYYYVHSSNNKVKGYVWHKYLK